MLNLIVQNDYKADFFVDEIFKCVVNKINQAKYDQSRILFELLQNADDAVKDLAENNELKVIEFSDETLDKIYSFFKEDEDEAIVRIEADQVQEIVDKIAKFAKAKKITNPTLVVPMDIRHMVFVILAEFVRNITVLAHEELVSDYNIKFVGKV